MKEFWWNAASQGAPQNYPSLRGSVPPPNVIPWTHLSPHSKWHLNWISRFSYVQQPDAHRSWNIDNTRLHLSMYCCLKINRVKEWQVQTVVPHMVCTTLYSECVCVWNVVEQRRRSRECLDWRWFQAVMLSVSALTPACHCDAVHDSCTHTAVH